MNQIKKVSAVKSKASNNVKNPTPVNSIQEKAPKALNKIEKVSKIEGKVTNTVVKPIAKTENKPMEMKTRLQTKETDTEKGQVKEIEKKQATPQKKEPEKQKATPKNEAVKKQTPQKKEEAKALPKKNENVVPTNKRPSAKEETTKNSKKLKK